MIRAAAFAAAVALLAASGVRADWTAERRPIADRKAVFATVESVHVADARARIAGTLTDLTVEEGDRVEGGAVIARVTDPKLPLEIAAGDARIEALAAERSRAELQLERMQRLQATGSTSQSQLDDAQAAFNVVTGQLAAARADREVLRERRREGTVLAPDAGRVLSTPVVAGTVVMGGERIAVIAVDRYVLRLRLPERHARFIHTGDPVEVGARGLAAEPETTRRGTVSKVYPELDHGLVIADVEVAGLGNYFVGERTRVWVSTGEREAMVVPRTLVYTRHGVDYVTLRAADGATAEVVVQTGRAQPLADGGDGIEILSGLAPGDTLVAP